MATDYNKLYEQENYYGEPYELLVNFFDRRNARGRVLDVGCGQGRNSIALARMGYDVTGIDTSEKGLEGLKTAAEAAGVQTKTIHGDVYSLESFADYDVVLVDSMLHYLKKDAEKEGALVSKILSDLKPGSLFCHCVKKNTRGLSYFTNVLMEHPAPFTILLDNDAEYPDQNTICHVFIIKKE